ncbi:uncharacterized protein G2W53_020256 [Senna tora]|uniref:Uncharacterized protein n=1 Tax=Senna tora TaxID=362788 RepID=A0A834TXL7_9FABA|nr:uncharacterized protein G2W53_020256 [Senna tora]
MAYMEGNGFGFEKPIISPEIKFVGLDMALTM